MSAIIIIVQIIVSQVELVSELDIAGPIPNMPCRCKCKDNVILHIYIYEFIWNNISYSFAMVSSITWHNRIILYCPLHSSHMEFIWIDDSFHHQAHCGIFCTYQDGRKVLSLFSEHEEKWKSSRQLITLAFSTHKLKLVRNGMYDTVNVYLTLIVIFLHV